MRRVVVMVSMLSCARAAHAETVQQDDVIPAVPFPRRVPPLELGLWTGGQSARERLGVGSAIAIDATGNLRLGYVIGAIGLRASWERYGLNGDHAGHTADVVGLSVPITVRVLQYVLWVPYLAVTPQLLSDRVRANIGVTTAVPDRIATDTQVAVQVALGLRLGGHSPLALHVETGYRFARTHAIANGDVNLSGVYITVSSRFGL
jgi:hypothetical protein